MHDDDRHDRGLAFDLATLRQRAASPPSVDRRGALKLLAGAGAGLVLAACGSGGDASSPTSTTGASTSASTAGSGAAAIGAIPAETGGPFPGDGSNGPNVLAEDGVVRQDLRSSFGAASGTAGGVPLTVDLTVVTAATGVPRTGAAVYAWHCDREGRYSLYSDGVEGENYLRGVQVADADGALRFTSVFPGAYSGRWPHIHFEVYRDLAEATGGGQPIVTSQLALPEDACAAAYATAGYEQSVTNLARTSLEADMVFSDGVEDQLATVTGSPEAGMAASLTVGV
jgi:protocatechuate 3,4-dioxygenase beta subunit